MTTLWLSANARLEAGVVAEFQSKLDPKQELQPRAFGEALVGLKELRGAMQAYDEGVAALQALDAACSERTVTDEALARILKEARPLPRLGRAGVRYADAGGLGSVKTTPVRGQTEILAALRTDLAILTESLDEVIVDLRDSMALVERGEFAAVMLSGRHGFGDNMPQFTEMFSAYQRFYVRTVMATIAATMQTFPAGYDWLTEGYKQPK